MTLTATLEAARVEVIFTSTLDLNTPDTTQAAYDISEIRSAIATLRAWERQLTDVLFAELGEGGTVDLGVIGRAEIKTGADEEWDDAAALAAVAREAIESRPLDDETGEIESEGQAVAKAVMACAGFGYWRKRALRARGIDPTRLCVSGPDRTWVSIK